MVWDILKKHKAMQFLLPIPPILIEFVRIIPIVSLELPVKQLVYLQVFKATQVGKLETYFLNRDAQGADVVNIADVVHAYALQRSETDDG